MIKSLAKRVLKHFRIQITRVPQEHEARQSSEEIANQLDMAHFLSAIEGDPLNADLHFQYAVSASKRGRPYLAYAELKTAEYLGATGENLDKYKADFKQALPDPKNMDHNQYFRFMSLSSDILNRGAPANVSILDVGGGEGQLASFLPNASYCLAEPTVNGISGKDLPFSDQSFDYVVACHVLEHIPIDERTRFLDQLLSKCKHGVILLNPFQQDGAHAEECLRLVLKVTGAQWAKEHLDCTLPDLNFVEEYAQTRRILSTVKPNGTMTTSLALIFVDHFASKSGLHQDLMRVNRLFNDKYMDILDTDSHPNAYLVYLERPVPKNL